MLDSDLSPHPAAPLSPEEHVELGREMSLTAAKLREFCRLIGDAYGAHSRIAFSFVQAVNALDDLNADMQRQAVQDSGGIETRVLYR